MAYDGNHLFEIIYNEDCCIPLVLAETAELLSSFSEDPIVNWNDKYCAIHLFLSLVMEDPGSDLFPNEVKKRRRKLNKKLVCTLDFFKANIVPELQGQDVNECPVLKSGALKFLSIFHNHVPMQLVVQLIPHVVRFLGSDSIVVRSYAALCLEKLLSARDYGVRTRRHNISQYLSLTVTNLCDALRASQFEDNPYIMSCIKHVLGVADIPQAIFQSCFDFLASVLRELCLSPKNPLFHRYLFEALAVVVRRASQDDSTLLSVFDAILFPIFQTILSNHIIEIFPFVFQLLAQFVELSRPPIPPYYMNFFELILLGDHWRKPSNVPSLVVLLQAFLQSASIELTQNGDLIKLAHVVVLLVSSSITVEVGFHILNVLLDNLEYEAFAPLASHIWPTLFLLLQDYPKVKLLKPFVIYISLFLIKHDAARLEQSMNSAQPDMFVFIMDVFWIPSLKLIKDTVELKLAAVALTMLVSGSTTLLDASRAERWGKMLDSIVTHLMQLKHDKAEEGQSFLGTQDTESSSATSVKNKEGPLTNTENANEVLVASLVDVSAQSSEKYPRIIQKYIDSVNQAALQYE